MSYQVALSFEDGVTRFITCADDQTVADASYRQRINIPLDCRDGACGTCKAFCESGTYRGGDYIEDALSADEAAAGYVLPCSMKPTSDLVLRIASTSAVAKTRAATFTGTLTGLDRLSPTTVAVTVETPQRDQLAFLPGQYVNITVPGTGQSRSYSFSNAPDDERLTFLVKLTPGGVMSDYLTERAAVGDELTFTGPNGSFFLRDTARPLVLLAGGTGLAPILSILRALRASGSTRPAHLLYGATTDDDVVELDTLRGLAKELPELTWDYCVADPASTAPNKGFVTGLLDAEHLHDGGVEVYLCGPPPMVEAVRTHVADLGVEPAGFYYEKFASSAPTTSARAEEPEPEVAADAAAVEQTTAPSLEPAAVPDQPVVSDDRDGLGDTVAARDVVPAGLDDGRGVAGQRLFAPATLRPLHAGARPDAAAEDTALRAIAGQVLWPGDERDRGARARDPGALPLAAGAARPIPGQEMLPALDGLAPLVAAAPSFTDDGYEIGEEHPPVHESDAVFEARQALELGAVELTIGRLNPRQLAEYRRLAEATVPWVDGDRFVDAAAYTEANAAFHDHLFTLTGNDHLLHAYRALGVTARMEETLRDADWCHPRCTRDHLDIVTAFEAGDRQAARELIVAHAERAMITTRTAMDKAKASKRPRFVSPGRFDGKVVVVTGAAQGIGEHTARRIAAEGGSLVLADRSDLVVELADELAGDGDPKAGEVTAVTADLETWQGAQDVVERALTRFGRIDVLINNVGGAIWFKPFTEFTEAQVQAEINRSLMTTLWCCRAALPSMVEQGGGVVVNVSSVATRGVHRIPYSAAKGGINALTASLAFEYADAGIRVVATAPGGTEAPPRRISRGGSALETEQEQAWFQAHIDQTLETSLLKRYGTLDEQAAAITFLASDEAAYITGTVLPVAGGDPG